LAIFWWEAQGYLVCKGW